MAGPEGRVLTSSACRYSALSAPSPSCQDRVPGGSPLPPGTRPSGGPTGTWSGSAGGYAAVKRAAMVATRLPWYTAAARAVSSTGIAPCPLTWLVP